MNSKKIDNENQTIFLQNNDLSEKNEELERILGQITISHQVLGKLSLKLI